MKKAISTLFSKEQRTVYTGQLDWSKIVLFVFFWCYGFCGAAGTANKIANLGLLLLFIVLQCVAYYGKKEGIQKIVVSNHDAAIVITAAAILLALSFSSLLDDIDGDALFHSQNSMLNTYPVIFKLNKRFPVFAGIPFKVLLQCCNLVMLAIVIAYLYLLQKTGAVIKIIANSIAFLIVRYIFLIRFGGFYDPHPPFRLFPLWLSSTLFSVSSFSFRLPQLLLLVGIFYSCYKFAAGYITSRLAILFAFSAVIIPVLWHSSILVEFSLYTTFGVLYLLFTLYDHYTKGTHTRFYPLISILSILVLIRQPNIGCLGIAFVFLLFSSKKLSWEWFRNLIITASPAFLLIPFILYSMFNGAPATASGSYGMTPVLIKEAIVSGLALIGAVNNLHLWILFFPFAFLITGKNRRAAIYIGILFLALFLEFYSIRPVLWGVGRYQAEFIAPFVILGYFFFMRKLEHANKKTIAYGVTFILIAYNLFMFYNIYNLNKPAEEYKTEFYTVTKKPFASYVLSQGVFPYGDALHQLKKEGHGKDIFIYGTTYGTFPFVLSGFPLHTMQELLTVDQKTSQLPENEIADYLVKDTTIKIALFGNKDNTNIMARLKANGWSDWRRYENPSRRSYLLALKRNEN